MESLPIGWTVHTCDQEGDGAELLKEQVPDTNANTHVYDLFHEDAQVGFFLCSISNLMSEQPSA